MPKTPMMPSIRGLEALTLGDCRIWAQAYTYSSSMAGVHTNKKVRRQVKKLKQVAICMYQCTSLPVHIFICVCIHVYTLAITNVNREGNEDKFEHTCTHLYIHVYMYIYAYTYIHTTMKAHISVCTQTKLNYTYKLKHERTCRHKHVSEYKCK